MAEADPWVNCSSTTAPRSEPGGPDPTGVERSAQILRAAGFDLVSLGEPIGKIWDLLGVGPWGLILVCVVRDQWPEPLGLQRLGVPPRWPAQTTRLIHRYPEGQSLPEVRVL